MELLEFSIPLFKELNQPDVSTLHKGLEMTEDGAEGVTLREATHLERCYRSLKYYCKAFWRLAEPARDFVPNWHVDLICDELEAVTRGEVDELVICCPPGVGKSLLVSVLWPTWNWVHYPEERTIHISNDEKLGEVFNLRARQIVTSPEYMRLLGHVQNDFLLTEDQNTKDYFVNTRSGSRLCISMDSNVTGKRGNIITDDPYDARKLILGTPQEISKRAREAVVKYENVHASRLDDYGRRFRVTTMQRLCDGDLADHLIDKGVRCVVLPMDIENEEDLKRKHPKDPRTEIGQLLLPQIHSREMIEAKKRNLTKIDWDAQYQQRTQPAGGRIFEKEWFQTFLGDPKVMFYTSPVYAFADLSFKDKENSDYVCIQIWAVKDQPGIGRQYFLLNLYRLKAAFTETRDLIKSIFREYPLLQAMHIEDKANGPAIINSLRKGFEGEVQPLTGRQVARIHEYDPGQVSKVARARVWSVVPASMRVFIPEEQYADWRPEFLYEITRFPGAEHDDQVDPAVMAWAVLEKAFRR